MKTEFDRLLRPQIRAFAPYLPGRSMESVRRERGLRRILKLASNENPLGPSPRALRALRRVGPGFLRYPDGASTALREALARKWKVPARRVIAGAGSDELIELLGKAFLNPGDSVVVSEHAFLRYRMAAELMGAGVITVPMRRYTHDLPAMGAALRADTKLLFIANPNNPTGTYNARAELSALLERVERANRARRAPVLVVVDEAYYEYARALAPDYPDTLALQKRYACLLTLRTFSKAHALAGLRIGYGLGEPAVIAALDRVRPPFNVSIAAQVSAQASLGDEAHLRRSVRLVESQRKEILPVLARWGLPVVPSVGNFFLVDVSPRRGAELFEKLLDRGIIVRSMDEYGYPNHVRVTYGLPQENRKFLQALKEVLGK